jgi:secretion/DNA translocation related TadE-like protein
VTRVERPVRDRGAGTVLAVGLVAVVLVLAAALAVLTQAATARHRAEAAADLAALAAADALLGRADGDPCARAARTAAANGARLASCAPRAGAVVRVVVEVRPQGPAGALGPARAVARAGPADAAG